VDILDFGALVEILPGKVGLMHISEITSDYVAKVTDKANVGDKITVKVINTSDDGKIGLSAKAMEPGYEPRDFTADKRHFGGRGGGSRGGPRGGFGRDRR